MEGRAGFKEMISKMPAAVREVCAAVGVQVADIDLLLLAHQANLRIIDAVAHQLALPKRVAAAAGRGASLTVSQGRCETMSL